MKKNNKKNNKSNVSNITKNLIILLFLLSIISLNVNADTIILNSKNWQDLYLSSILAGKTNNKFLYFLNLGDAEIKTQTIKKNETIIILESKNPVVKNYNKVINVNGFEKKPETIYYNDYKDLQKIILENNFKTKSLKEKLKKIDEKKYFVIYDKYSLEALSATPTILKEKYNVLLLDERTKDDIKKILKNANEIIIAGHIPIRLLRGIDYDKLKEEGKIKKEFLNYPVDNAYNLTIYFTKKHPSEWGVLMTPERVDLYSIQEKIPVFLYVGYLQELSKIIQESKVEKFEIISGAIVNIAKELEKKSGKDLKLVVKYGRTVTKIKGLEGQLLDLDTIRTPYPYSDLKIEKVEYYTIKENKTEKNTILITFKNTGNVNTRFYSNIEYKDNSLSDNYTHTILKGETFSIPYYVEEKEIQNFLDKNNKNDNQVVINTKFDMALPLRKNILNEKQIPIIVKKIKEKKTVEDNSNIIIKKVEFDDKRGKFIVQIKNPSENNVKTKIEIYIDESNVFTSKEENLKPKEEKNIILETPYFEKSQLNFEKKYSITVYYGIKDTYKIKNINMKILEVKNLFSFAVLTPTTYAITGIILIIILSIILFLFLKKKKK